MKIQPLFIHSTRPFWNFTAIQHSPKQLKHMGMVIHIFGSPEATNWFEKSLFTPFGKLESSLQLRVDGVNDIPSNQIGILGLGLCWTRCSEPLYDFFVFYSSCLGECFNTFLQWHSGVVDDAHGWADNDWTSFWSVLILSLSKSLTWPQKEEEDKMDLNMRRMWRQPHLRGN